MSSTCSHWHAARNSSDPHSDLHNKPAPFPSKPCMRLKRHGAGAEINLSFFVTACVCLVYASTAKLSTVKHRGDTQNHRERLLSQQEPGMTFLRLVSMCLIQTPVGWRFKMNKMNHRPHTSSEPRRQHLMCSTKYSLSVANKIWVGDVSMVEALQLKE